MNSNFLAIGIGQSLEDNLRSAVTVSDDDRNINRACGYRRHEVQAAALILDTDDEIFIAADAADMAKQLVGLLYGGWLAYAWGWAAPAVRRQEQATRTDDGVRIISGTNGRPTTGEAQQSVAPVPDDAIKIISGPAKLDETKE